MHRYPHLYEINACLFTRQMSRKYQRPLTLEAIPEEEWQALVRRGFELVWLMGVWQRSPAARWEALRHSGLRREYEKALPGWREEDIDGSPYAVYSYELNPALGQPSELARLRSKLNLLGLKLILDFVSNHIARDHPWVGTHPRRFVAGKAQDVQAHPDWFFSPDGRNYFAHGRDPYFPPWTDTIQLNHSSADLRRAMIAELVRVAEVADGVRCDMAMLALNDVFEQIWGNLAGYRRPGTEFWAEAISHVKERQPGFLFLAEAYWGLEPQLQQLGFDFTYDKTLYDRLKFSEPQEIRSHLADPRYQQHSIRFIENHDEERAATAFGRERSRAAAVIVSTVPGLRLFHAGQLEGYRVRLPVQLLRQPEEAADADILRFYDRLLTVCEAPVFRAGEWELLELSPRGQENDGHHNILSWRWRYDEQSRLVVVNYSPNRSRGWLRLSPPPETIERITLPEELSGEALTLDVIRPSDLELDLEPWEARILNMENTTF